MMDKIPSWKTIFADEAGCGNETRVKPSKKQNF